MNPCMRQWLPDGMIQIQKDKMKEVNRNRTREAQRWQWFHAWFLCLPVSYVFSDSSSENRVSEEPTWRLWSLYCSCDVKQRSESRLQPSFPAADIFQTVNVSWLTSEVVSLPRRAQPKVFRAGRVRAWSADQQTFCLNTLSRSELLWVFVPRGRLAAFNLSWQTTKTWTLQTEESHEFLFSTSLYFNTFWLVKWSSSRTSETFFPPHETLHQAHLLQATVEISWNGGLS